VELAISSAVLVTIFLGGWNLPFLHRDGITVAFGDTVLFHQPLLHWVVVLIGALTFFGKTILFTWFQVFIRWTIPRFRYDQIMKLGWRKLLPLSLVNMVVTAVVLLAIDLGGTPLASGLQLAGDASQALVVVLVVGAVVWFVAWALRPVRHEKLVLSSSARFAEARGGVKPSAMQA
jgi:NADH-quinone oxidoreductase subunit H